MWPLLAAGCGVGLLALPGAYAAGWWLTASVLLAAIGIAAVVGLPGLRLLLWLSLGYLYGHWQIGAALAERLPHCADAVVRVFEMSILDAPVLTQLSGPEGRTVARFQARVTVRPGDDCLPPGEYRVRLSWYEPPALQSGERWRVQGRLRPPWGNLNPGGFDYERWLLGQGLSGTGYVRDGTRSQAGPAAGARARIRAAFRHWLEGRDSEHAGIMLALMSGDDSALKQTEWRALRDSGTVHLLVVSGLHVGMVSGVLFLLGRLLAGAAGPLLLWIGARRLAGLFALAGSAAYVWLSGAGVPAMRAWLMSAVVLLALSGGRLVRGLDVVLLVMALLLLMNPLVVHQQGFWLSFAAVLALVAWFEPTLPAVRPTQEIDQPAAGGRVCGLLRRFGPGLLVFAQVQIVLMIALSPLLSAFQGGVPLQSPLVNALVVPLVTFLVLPVLLLAALVFFLLPAVAEALLTLAEAALDLVMLTVATAAEVPATAMHLAGAGQWLLMLLLLLWLGQRPAWRLLPLALSLWWVLLLPDGRMPSFAEFRVTALDVGQGSAILVDTNRHRLIFDAGPRFSSGFDLGDAVVVPSFQRLGSARLDVLVLSHDDLDHTGGAGAVVEQLQPRRVLASFPFDADDADDADDAVDADDAGRGTGAATGRCRAGLSWHWDGVSFRFLHPGDAWTGNDNDQSCVLLISNGRRSALLAGDISSRIERRLPKQPVDLLMAPHHGSRTSSSRGFVSGFAPAVVFISTDRRSRYGHPHPDVLGRYAGSVIAITGRAGALTWESRQPGEVGSYRQRRAAYWHRQAAGLRP